MPMGQQTMTQLLAEYFKTQPVLKAWLFGSYASGSTTTTSMPWCSTVSGTGTAAAKVMDNWCSPLSFISFYLLLTPFIYRASGACES